MIRTKKASIHAKIYQLNLLSLSDLQLGLLSRSEEVGHHEVTDFTGGFVEVEAHSLGTDLLADDVELEAKKVKKIVMLAND